MQLTRIDKKSARRRLAPKSAEKLNDKGALCLFGKTEATRGAGAWSLDTKKSARRRLAPKSAGRLDDKGALCLFGKTEATRGAGTGV